MNANRITHATTRIAAALDRIDAARIAAADANAKADAKASAGSARVVELVNAHERLREQVAESLSQLDGLLATLDTDAEPEGKP